jgi:small subunit ribosomal protein S17
MDASMSELNSTKPVATSPTPTAAAAGPAPVRRGQRKERIGVVVSNKMHKTIIVRVERRFPHPRYGKIITAYKKFYAHDETNQAQVGDRVRIMECRPLSKTKRWRLVEILERAAATPAASA